MTFPLGSLRSDGAAPSKGGERRIDATASVRVTGRLHRQPPAQTIEPAEPVENTARFQAGLLVGGLLWLLALLGPLVWLVLMEQWVSQDPLVWMVSMEQLVLLDLLVWLVPME